MKNDIVEAIVEIPYGSKNKYERDEETGLIKLDRVIYSTNVYPAEYGILEGTLALDNDPLDILILSNEKTYPGCIVPARILGYLEMIDNGYPDYKLISVVDVDPRFNEIKELTDLAEFTLSEIKNFFENYKVLQNVVVEVGDYHSKEEALKLIEECKIRYQNQNK